MKMKRIALVGIILTALQLNGALQLSQQLGQKAATFAKCAPTRSFGSLSEAATHIVLPALVGGLSGTGLGYWTYRRANDCYQDLSDTTSKFHSDEELSKEAKDALNWSLGLAVIGGFTESWIPVMVGLAAGYRFGYGLYPSTYLSYQQRLHDRIEWELEDSSDRLDFELDDVYKKRVAFAKTIHAIQKNSTTEKLHAKALEVASLAKRKMAVSRIMGENPTVGEQQAMDDVVWRLEKAQNEYYDELLQAHQEEDSSSRILE